MLSAQHAAGCIGKKIARNVTASLCGRNGLGDESNGQGLI